MLRENLAELTCEISLKQKLVCDWSEAADAAL